MRVDRLTEPAALLTLAETKAHLRVDGTTEDTQITALIASATQRVEAYLGRSLMSRNLSLVLDAFPEGTIAIPLPPCISLTDVKYIDTAGTQQTLAASAYILSVPSGPKAQRARIAPVTTWPATKAVMDAVKITYAAGYSTVPDVIKEGVLLIVGALYNHRGDETTEDAADLSAAYHLLEPWKVFL